MFSPLIDNLLQALRCLPGVGPKTAQRMVFHLLARNRQGGEQLSTAMLEAMQKVGNCLECRTFSEQDKCKICSNPSRDESQLCVVENAADVLALEQAGGFSGKYFVLHGKLSPIDGIGPEEIGVADFKERLQTGLVSELILATNSTVEGDATAYYLAELARKHNIKTSRIAHGVPVGGELEYLDSNTLSRALSSRYILKEI